MKKILVLFDNSLYYWQWLLPLKWCQKEFNEENIKIYFERNIRFKILKNFLNKKTSGIFQISDLEKILENKYYDIITLSFHYKHDFFKLSEQERINIFNYIRRHCEKIVWLDPSDSTGTTTFSVLSYVDIYLKKQLLLNKKLYMKFIYGKRLYTEHYHRQFGLDYEDGQQTTNDILEHSFLNKIDVSWNVGIGFIIIDKNKYINFVKSILGLKKNYLKIKKNEFKKKNFNIFFNGTFEGNGALLFQRRMSYELINSLNDENSYSPYKRLSRDDYLLVMKNTKYILSPFGYGEICFRDFEAFIFGGCLLKPNMSHIETWPNYFKFEKTYFPLNWNFSNFSKAMMVLEEDESIVKKIAENGFENFMKYDLNDVENRKKFVNHVKKVFKI